MSNPPFVLMYGEFGKGFKATSIFREGVNVDAEDVLKQIYDYLDFYYNLLKQSNFKLLLKLYYSQMFWFEQLGEFIKNEECFKAIVLGVSELGLLKLKLESGQIKTYDIKEVKFVY